MFQQDYIVRQIQQLVEVLNQVLGKQEGKREEAQELIEQALKSLTQNSSKKFHELTLSDTLYQRYLTETKKARLQKITWLNVLNCGGAGS